MNKIIKIIAMTMSLMLMFAGCSSKDSSENTHEQVETISKEKEPSEYSPKQVKEYLEEKGYVFEAYELGASNEYSNTPKYITISNENENISIVKMVGNDLSEHYLWSDTDINDNIALIKETEKNIAEENKAQFTEYNEWLSNLWLTSAQVIEVIDYYHESVSEYKDMLEDSSTVSNTDNIENKKSISPEHVFIEGQYKVGKDIPAGDYFLMTDDSGYFCVSADANDDDIVFNDNFKGNSIITIYDGEYLTLNRCTAATFSEISQDVFEGKTVLTDGMYKVGYHIPAGEYKLTANTGNSGYVCVYADTRHDDIITNDNFENSRYITVSDGQYLLLDRCSLALN